VERVKLLKIVLFVLAPLLAVAAIGVYVSGALPYKVYVVHTGSMAPTIASKSAVLVHEGEYHVGQVVTFTENGLTVTHRLVSIDPQGLITTKGDANATADPWHVPQSQIIGGVVTTVPELGYWLVYLKNPIGLVSVLLTLLVLWQIWSIGKPSAVAAERRRRAPRRAPSHARPRRGQRVALAARYPMRAATHPRGLHVRTGQ
jgi:signal peptidase I